MMKNLTCNEMKNFQSFLSVLEQEIKLSEQKFKQNRLNTLEQILSNQKEEEEKNEILK